MKKTLNILVCIITICTLLSVAYICPLASHYIFTSEYPIFYQNPATVYFSQLDTNFSRNEEGTCAYIAIAMLLSYYDTFWYDGFIAEQYDKSGSFAFDEDNRVITMGTSPGVEKEPAYSTLTNTYDQLVDLYNDRYFQAMLIEMQSKTYYSGEDPNDTTHTYGLNFFETYTLMMYYLVVWGQFDLSHLIIQDMSIEDGDTVQSIRTQTIQNIANGIPTIYFGLPSSGDVGHVMVAYDYDVTNDEIYYHTGWDEERVISDSYNNYYNTYGIIWISLYKDELEHTCSNNYIDSNTNQAVCMCKFAFHPQHTHTLTGDYLSYDSLSHMRECVYCDTAASEAHNLRYVRLSSTQHRSICDCGRITIDQHMAKANMVRCMLCGAPLDIDFIVGSISDNNQSFVRLNDINNDGTYLTNSGVIILSDSDYDFYINGELTISEIYEKVGLVYGD